MKQEINKEVFSIRFRQLMDEHNETIYTVAELLNLSPATISRYSTGKMSPKITTIEVLSRLYGINPAWLMGYSVKKQAKETSKLKAIRIPVLGHIPAGTPIDAIEDILDWEELDPREYNANHDYFGLMVRGDSMYPEYFDGDIIIVQQDPTPESGKDVVAYVNGFEATLKRLYKYENGNIELRAINPNYESKKFTQNEMEETPVVIMGYVRELRRVK